MDKRVKVIPVSWGVGEAWAKALRYEMIAQSVFGKQEQVQLAASPVRE